MKTELINVFVSGEICFEDKEVLIPLEVLRRLDGQLVEVKFEVIPDKLCSPDVEFGKVIIKGSKIIEEKK